MYKLSLAGALPDQMETQPIDVMTVATPQHKDNPISPQHSAVEKRMVFQSKGNVNPNGHGHEACLETPAKPVEITHENEDRKVGDKSHEKENNDENNKSDEKEPTHEKKKKKKDGKQKEIETNDTKEKTAKTSEKKDGEFTESDDEAGLLFKEKYVQVGRHFSTCEKSHGRNDALFVFICGRWSPKNLRPPGWTS